MDKIKINVSDMLTIDEIAQALGCGIRTAYTYVRNGKIKAVKVAGKWRASQEAVESFLMGNQQ